MRWRENRGPLAPIYWSWLPYGAPSVVFVSVGLESCIAPSNFVGCLLVSFWLPFGSLLVSHSVVFLLFWSALEIALPRATLMAAFWLPFGDDDKQNSNDQKLDIETKDQKRKGNMHIGITMPSGRCSKIAHTHAIFLP